MKNRYGTANRFVTIPAFCIADIRPKVRKNLDAPIRQSNIAAIFMKVSRPTSHLIGGEFMDTVPESRTVHRQITIAGQKHLRVGFRSIEAKKIAYHLVIEI